MAQTKEGAKKALATIREKYGKDYYKAVGRIGGVARNPNKGFGTNRELARTAGAKGGSAKRKSSGGKSIV